MLVYAVEMWSNGLRPDAHQPNQQLCHHVEVVHIASSEKAAKKWALDNLEYGGMQRKHPGYFFPWHFRIRRWLIDEDVGGVVANNNIQVGKEIHPRKYHKRGRP